MNNNDNDPWDFIVMFLIGSFLTEGIIKHWRGIGAFIVAFLAYEYLMMAFHYLASLL